jgi:anti-anti-sigma regulatory factor
MSPTATIHAHITYELIGDSEPVVVVIDFQSPEILGSVHARELREQLASLAASELPHNFLIDFSNVRTLGSSAFTEILWFAHNVSRLTICNLKPQLRLGAAMVGLGDCAEITADRRSGINAARRAAIRDQEDTVDYPASMVEFD